MQGANTAEKHDPQENWMRGESQHIADVAKMKLDVVKRMRSAPTVELANWLRDMASATTVMNALGGAVWIGDEEIWWERAR